MAFTVATWSYKGGASKTTTCLNTAAALHSLGFTVAVIDQDEQATTVALSGLAGMPFPVLSASEVSTPPNVDFLFLDYPPGYAGAEISQQQDLLLVPVRPVWTDYEATKRGLKSLGAGNQVIVIAAMVEQQREPHKVFVDRLRKEYGDDMPVIPKRSVIEDTNNYGLTVFDMPLQSYGVRAARSLYMDIATRIIKLSNKQGNTP